MGSPDVGIGGFKHLDQSKKGQCNIFMLLRELVVGPRRKKRFENADPWANGSLGGGNLDFCPH